MAAATITTATPSYAAAIGSSRSTSMCRDARRPPKHCSTACCNSRRRSAARGTWSGEARAVMDQLGNYIVQASGATTAMSVRLGELMLETTPDQLIALLKFLRDDPKCLFNQLIDVCGVDWPEREKRFDVVYNLLSLRNNQRVRVKVATDETTPVPSAAGLYSSANWFERETYDLYGVWFSDHPDLRRLLTHYVFEGHPLRNDLPLPGFVE